MSATFTPRSLEVPAPLVHRWDLVDFSAAGFPGFMAEAWVTCPMNLVEDLLGTKDEKQVRELVLKLWPNWNFVDENGVLYPHTTEGLGLMPQPLIVQLIRQFQEHVMGAPDPNSRTP